MGSHGPFLSSQRLFGHLVWLLGQGSISCSSQVCGGSFAAPGIGQDGASTAGDVAHPRDRTDPKDSLGLCLGSSTA